MNGERLGDCELLEPLALGAHGQIYLAQIGGEGGELVAVKCLLPELVQKREAVVGFFDEIRLCQHIRHPNIVQVYKGDVHRGQPYIVMELVDGVSLYDVVARTRDRGMWLPVPVGVHATTMIGEALAYAHTLRDEQGRPLRLVHRDVSTVNVMVSFDGAVKLLDFGIARSTIREHRTQPGIIRGKPQYLSPEQCSQGEIDHLTDIYSLGVVLFELLTGERPFVDDDVYQLIRRIQRGDRPRARDLRPEITPQLDAVVERAMALARDERYQSASQMVRDLRACAAAEGEPGTTGRLADIVRSLFPERIDLVVERYGPPETTAVDTRMPEARLVHAGELERRPPAPGPSEGAVRAQVDELRGEARPEPAPPVGPGGEAHPGPGPVVPPAGEPAPWPDLAPRPIDPGAAPAGLAPRAGRAGRLAGAPPRARALVLAGLAVALLAGASVAATLVVRARGQVELDDETEMAGIATEAEELDDLEDFEVVPESAASDAGPAASGHLVVRVTPSRAVVVAAGRRTRAEDGLARLDLPAGAHEVRVRAGGYRLERFQLDIAEGETHELEVALVRAWSYLSVRADKRGTVFVDGRSLGPAPVHRHKLRPGSHLVTFKADGRVQKRRVRLGPDEAHSVRFGR